MKIVISLPFDGAERSTETWAYAHNEIDFLHDKISGCRCTVAFAASELKRCIQLLIPDAQVTYAQGPSEDSCIALSFKDYQSDSCAYTLIPHPNGVSIVGEGRVGVLYGAYTFLKQQGFRWFFPDKRGEYVPAVADRIIWPQQEETFKPDMEVGRGFDLEGMTPEGETVWLWMARNRLNVVRRNAAAEGLQRKLGMKFKEGGHIFEPMLHPAHTLNDGRTVWDAHPEWYGKPAAGTVTPENALRTQFCVSNPGLVSYLSQTLVHRLRTTWSYADRVDVWGFDTWGSTCQCEKCRTLGNGSDQMLHFLSGVRKAINEAELDHPVELVMCAYEGTDTLPPPEHDIPKNLVDAGDLVVYYPITRCYRHNIDHADCWENDRFYRYMKGWLAKTPTLRMVIGEYYNVSKFEDLPLIFTERMTHDIPEYIRMGIQGITYMHFPIADMSLRALNHVLYAELSWDATLNPQTLIEDYFAHVYGEYTSQVQTAYSLLESAWTDCAQLRSWSNKSILSQLINWNGGIPQEPLQLCDQHYQDVAELIRSMENSIQKMQQADRIFAAVRKSRLDAYQPVAHKAAVNPAELGKATLSDLIEFRVASHLRFVRYGIDVMQLTLLCVKAHDQLYRNEPTEETFRQMGALFEKMEMYTMGFAVTSFILDGVDALTRSQLRGTIMRCLNARQA